MRGTLRHKICWTLGIAILIISTNGFVGQPLVTGSCGDIYEESIPSVHIYSAVVVPTIDGVVEDEEWDDAQLIQWSWKGYFVSGESVRYGNRIITQQMKRNSTHCFLNIQIPDQDPSRDPKYMNDTIYIGKSNGDGTQNNILAFSNGSSSNNGYFMKSGLGYSNLSEIDGNFSFSHDGNFYIIEMEFSLLFLNITTDDPFDLKIGYFDGVNRNHFNQSMDYWPYHFFDSINGTAILENGTYSVGANIIVSNIKPQLGEKIYISGVCWNNGSASLNDIDLCFFMNSEVFGNRSIPSLPSKSEYSTFPIEFVTNQGGKSTISLKFHGITFTEIINVVPLESKPRITGFSFSRNPLLLGQTSTVEVYIQNIGNLNANDLSLEIIRNGTILFQRNIDKLHENERSKIVYGIQFIESGNIQVLLNLYEGGLLVDSVNREIHVSEISATNTSYYPISLFVVLSVLAVTILSGRKVYLLTSSNTP